MNFLNKMLHGIMRSNGSSKSGIKKEVKYHVYLQSTVKNIVARGGVTVMLGPNIQGFIPDIHLADIPLKHPENFYETGKTVRCKVMSSSLPPINCKILEKVHSWNP